MPTGPKGQKRPADVIGNAVHVMRIVARRGGPGSTFCPSPSDLVFLPDPGFLQSIKSKTVRKKFQTETLPSSRPRAS
jgi:hypothetical protein